MSPTCLQPALSRIAAAGLTAAMIIAVVPFAYAEITDGGLTRPSVTPSRVVLIDDELFQPVPDLEPPAGLTDAVAVATSSFPSGGNSALAIRADGAVVGWGSDAYGQTSVPDGLTDAVAVDVGGGFAMALRSDGSVAAWGSNASGVVDVPKDLGPVIDIAAGGTQTTAGACGYALAIRSDHTVARWGAAQPDGTCRTLTNRYDPPAGLTDVVAISAGDTAAVALKSDGTVVAWGPSYSANGNGILLGRWTDLVDVDTRGGRFVGVQADGQALSLGYVGQTPLPPLPSDAVRVSAGYPGAVLRSDGRITTIAGGTYTSEPGFQAVAAGYYYLLAIAAPEVTDPDGPGDPGGEPQQPETAALGSSQVQPGIDGNPAGTAEAFQSVATRDAVASELRFYLDESSTARSLVVGIYADRNGEPGRLLGSGRTRSLTAGDWNAIAIDEVALTAGQAYWLAVLTPVRGGVVRFRDLPDGDGGPTRISREHRLTWRAGLPARWRTGQSFANAPASFFVA